MKKLMILLIVFCSFPIIGSAQSSLADAARKERERQKEVKSSVTFTGIAATTTATTSSAVSSVPVVKPFVLTDRNGHDEKYWRERFDKARTDLKTAEDRVQLLDNRVKGLNTDLLRGQEQSVNFNKENTVGPEITGAQKQLEDARNQVEQARQKISDLEDELHRADGPAGWAR